jgi:hypothetical protein
MFISPKKNSFGRIFRGLKLGRVLTFLIVAAFSYSGNAKQLIIDFYEQKLVFEYSETVVLKKKFNANENDFKKFYETISESDYRSLLDTLEFYKDEYQLNDWLYYLLINKVCSGLEKRPINASYLEWFLLGKSGYRSKATFSKSNFLIWVDSEESLVGLRRLGESYCINCGELNFEFHGLSRFNPFKNNKKKFSFAFNPLPVFVQISYTKKVFRLRLPDASFKEVEVQFNNVLLSCLKDFDGFNMSQVFSVPLSSGTKTLIEEIAKVIKDYSDSAKVEYLTTFTRINSKYKEDREYFGKEKWMTPEEYLFYDSGDCDDRSSFLYYILKEIVGKPIIIIDYPNSSHVNIGISLDLKMKPNFFYKGKPYYVAEPTVLFGSIPLGADDSFKKTKYEIIGEYNPEDTSEQKKPH